MESKQFVAMSFGMVKLPEWARLRAFTTKGGSGQHTDGKGI